MAVVTYTKFAYTESYPLQRRLSAVAFRVPGLNAARAHTSGLIGTRAKNASPQVSGTVDPGTVLRAELIMQDGTVVDTARVNPADGTFAFEGFYSELYTEYALRFIAPAGIEEKTFPLTALEYRDFRGIGIPGGTTRP